MQIQVYILYMATKQMTSDFKYNKNIKYLNVQNNVVKQYTH